MPQKLPLIAVLTGASLLAGTATAQSTGPKLGDVGTEIVHCGEFDDPAIRLKCFDATLPALKGLLTPSKAAATAPATAPAAADAAPVAEVKPEDKFGGGDFARKVEEAQGQAEPDSITSTITQHATDPLGHTVFFLANGQVWIQTDLPTLAIKRPNQSVTISRGLIGGYKLTGEKLWRAVSVKRLH